MKSIETPNKNVPHQEQRILYLAANVGNNVLYYTMMTVGKVARWNYKDKTRDATLDKLEQKLKELLEVSKELRNMR